jgi:hypothetical protein
LGVARLFRNHVRARSILARELQRAIVEKQYLACQEVPSHEDEIGSPNREQIGAPASLALYLPTSPRALSRFASGQSSGGIFQKE